MTLPPPLASTFSATPPPPPHRGALSDAPGGHRGAGAGPGGGRPPPPAGALDLEADAALDITGEQRLLIVAQGAQRLGRGATQPRAERTQHHAAADGGAVVPL